MNKKLEHEILMRKTFDIEQKNGGSVEAEVRIKRRGTKFYVEKSGFYGPYALHVNSYDDIEPAYSEYEMIINSFS